MLQTHTTYARMPQPFLGQSFELNRIATETAMPDTGETDTTPSRSPLLRVMASSQQQGASDMMPAPVGSGRLALPPACVWPQW